MSSDLIGLKNYAISDAVWTWGSRLFRHYWFL